MKELLVAGLCVVVGLIIAYFLLRGPIQARIVRDQYITQCTIENKELPRPDLYCWALWKQGGEK